jgi:hypothetical protein
MPPSGPRVGAVRLRPVGQDEAERKVLQSLVVQAEDEALAVKRWMCFGH